MPELPRTIGSFDSAALLVGSVIGSGIFVVPSLIARRVPEPGLVIGIWMLSGLLVLCGALTLDGARHDAAAVGRALCVHWIFFNMVVLWVIVLRRKHPEWERPYRVAGYPFTVIVFVLVSSAFVINTLIGSAESSLMGLGLLLLGVPFYLRSRRLQRA